MSIGQIKPLAQKDRILRPQVIINTKTCTKMSSIIIIVEYMAYSHLREKSCVVIFKCTCHNCAKEGHVARKCTKKLKTRI